MAEPAIRSQPGIVAATSLFGAQWLTLLPPAMRLVLHADAAARSAVAGVWGASLPEEACRANVSAERAALWLGPDEYLLLAPQADSISSMTGIETALGALPHALVDVSHRQIALQLQGPHAATILSGGCPLDLSLEEFPVNMCTRTVFSKADIVLWRTADEQFHVEVWRSFTGYVTGLLREIGREFDHFVQR
jgi:sarcosine oxidase, subunit gamma